MAVRNPTSIPSPALTRSLVLAVATLGLVLLTGCPPRNAIDTNDPEKTELPPLTLKLDRIQDKEEETLLKLAEQVPEVQLGRDDPRWLPMQTGPNSQLSRDQAQSLEGLSNNLRGCIANATSRNDPRVNVDALKRGLASSGSEWRKPAAIPVLMQMLQAESEDVRLELIDRLALIDDKRATRALAVRAMVDFSSKVRAAAVQRLLDTKRPKEDYRDLFVAGLRYPSLEIQQHAAEAIVAVEDRELTSQLAEMLDERQPFLPYPTRVGNNEIHLKRELVRVNHLRNCMLCHPASSNKGDTVRAAIPKPGQELGSVSGYNGDTFVRADVTFLRQDFSVHLPASVAVEKWPAYQRYDFLIRTRPAAPQEVMVAEQFVKARGKAELRGPVHFALRKLTGEDHGLEGTTWRERLGAPAHALRTERIPADDDWRQFEVPGLAKEPKQ